MANKGVALHCAVFPASKEKETRVLDLLRTAAREYYRRPDAKCTTWTYYTPLKPAASGDREFHGLEIYTEKSALSAQLNDPVYYQSYHEIVKREEIYARPEALVAWYLAAGFLAREDHARPFGGGVLISETKFVCSDKNAVLELLRGFAPWVRANEPDVLSYAAFERAKAPKEVFLFVRYKNTAALKSHSNAPEHVDVVKKLSKHMENSLAKSTTMWREVDDSFVSNHVGSSTEMARL